MNLTLKNEIERTFLQTLSDLKKIDELKMFLTDLMGTRDFERYVKKLAAIYWIRKNRSTDVIKNNLDISQKEINDITKLMNNKGIKLAIKYMEAEEFANVWSKRIKEFTKKG